MIIWSVNALEDHKRFPAAKLGNAGGNLNREAKVKASGEMVKVSLRRLRVHLFAVLHIFCNYSNRRFITSSVLARVTDTIRHWWTSAKRNTRLSEPVSVDVLLSGPKASRSVSDVHPGGRVDSDHRRGVSCQAPPP